MNINEFEIGDFITRIQDGEQSYVGGKYKLIKLTNKTIFLKSYCVDDDYEIEKLHRKQYNNNWFKYIESDEDIEALDDDIFGYGQLRLQHLYLGFELEKMRGNNNNSFGNILMTCRAIEEKLGSRI
ncbi:MAG TPA: hypothetical protein VIK86_06355 [Candidatus Paceibacterota bacterium]